MSKSNTIEHPKEGHEIKTDFGLVLEIAKETIIFFVMFIPRLIFILFYLVLFNFEKVNYYLNKTILFPFHMCKLVFDWFFKAKVTSTLILVLIVAYILEILLLVPNQTLFDRLVSNPIHIFEGNYYSMLTSVFLHADIFHLLYNCAALLIFGRIVERHFGKNTLWIFLASGVISSFISNLVYYFQGDLTPSVGASGAIAGLIIIAILINPFAFTTALLIPLPIFVLGWIIIISDLFGVLTPGKVNHVAHLAGYFALLILFFFMELRLKEKIISGALINIGIIIMLFIVSFFFDFSAIINI